MLPGSSANKIHEDGVNATEERPAKIAAVAIPENESDDEYEDVPSRRKKDPHQGTHGSEAGPPKSPQVRASKVQDPPRPGTDLNADPGPQPTEEVSRDDEDQDSTVEDPAVPATDDDWLRSRTNRLLDLVDEDDDIPTPVPSQPVHTTSAVTVHEEDKEVKEPEEVYEEPAPEPMDVEEPAEPETKDSDGQITDSIRKTSRLFVRNLPYFATEDDLRKHFEQYGNLEEVRRYFLLPLIIMTPGYCMMNPR